MSNTSQMAARTDDLEASRRRQEKRMKQRQRRRSRKTPSTNTNQASSEYLSGSVESSLVSTGHFSQNALDKEVQTDSVSSEPVDESTIVCNVNGQAIYLHFKNYGNNDPSEIGTYLQEKLDVLEFIQMDCSRMETSIVFPTSKVYASEPAPTVSVSRRSSVSEATSSSSWFQDRSVLEPEGKKGGFFIGTPSVVSGDLSLLASEGEHSELRWETESMASPSSRRRSCSVSSVSSVESVKSWRRTKGVFGRSRMGRMLADLNRSDTPPSETGTFSPRTTSTWWGHHQLQ